MIAKLQNACIMKIISVQHPALIFVAVEHVIARKRHVQHLTESKKNSEGGVKPPRVSVAMHMSEHNNDGTFRWKKAVRERFEETKECILQRKQR